MIGRFEQEGAPVSLASSHTGGGTLGDTRLAGAGADIVVVPRERYSSTIESVRCILDSVPEHIRVVVVRGGMPNRTCNTLADLDHGRVEIVGPARHLAPNAARAIGLHHSTARYVVFVDNDIFPSKGWLEPLLNTAIDEDAWVVRPVVMQSWCDGRVTVHETGGDCHLEEQHGHTRLVRSHRHLGQDPDIVASLGRERVEMFEFHAVLFDRARLVEIGGPDERMLAQGDHLDLALRVRAAGGGIWLEPKSRVTYKIPDRVAVRELSFFLGRWSPSWIRSSRTAFCTEHGIEEPDGPDRMWRYADEHRAYAWLPIGRAAAAVARRGTPLAAARQFDRLIGRHIADRALRLDPRWRGGRQDHHQGQLPHAAPD